MTHDCDVLVIGGGAAAVRAAVEAAQPGTRVVLVDKGDFERSGTTPLSLHGLVTTLHATDSPQHLMQDIVRVGGNLNDYDLVRRATDDAGREPEQLEALGIHFHREEGGQYHIYRGDGHSVPHGLTFDHDDNGLNFVTVLAKEAWKRGVTLIEKVMIVDLLVDNGQVFGAVGIAENEAPWIFSARAIVLAAGGANRIFPNVETRIINEMYRTTGDGLVLALRAGLNLVDMEMANFRNSPPASRLKARYINAKGEAFMSRYDPMGDHASRGKVVEALFREMQAGNGPIHMEITEESERIAEFSPMEYKNYVRAYKEGKRPPVTITFQRLLGGAHIKADASTAVRGLYAAGESSGGFHGGDRLQGAAFLETQVFGRLAGVNARQFACSASRENKVEKLAAAPAERVRQLLAGGNGGPAADVIRRVQKIAWDYASIVKDAAGLNTALGALAEIKDQIQSGLTGRYVFEPLEAENLAITAEAIVRASLQREETRATHRRRDFQQPDEKLKRVHTSVTLKDRMVAEFVPCRD